MKKMKKMKKKQKQLEQQENKKKYHFKKKCKKNIKKYLIIS